MFHFKTSAEAVASSDVYVIEKHYNNDDLRNEVIFIDKMALHEDSTNAEKKWVMFGTCRSEEGTSSQTTMTAAEMICFWRFELDPETQNPRPNSASVHKAHGEGYVIAIKPSLFNDEIHFIWIDSVTEQAHYATYDWGTK